MGKMDQCYRILSVNLTGFQTFICGKLRFLRKTLRKIIPISETHCNHAFCQSSFYLFQPRRFSLLYLLILFYLHIILGCFYHMKVLALVITECAMSLVDVLWAASFHRIDGGLNQQCTSTSRFYITCTMFFV